MNVFEFRQRAFQFDRLVTVASEPYAVFVRTETESESQFRPTLVHLTVVVPLGWVVYDEGADALRIARDGTHPSPVLTEPVVEVGAEPAEFSEQGVRWKRSPLAAGRLVYVPEEREAPLLAPEALGALTGP